jgi:hypothetical protein
MVCNNSVIACMSATSPITSHSEAATPVRLCEGPLDAMFCPFPADVAQLVEQRFRKP